MWLLPLSHNIINRSLHALVGELKMAAFCVIFLTVVKLKYTPAMVVIRNAVCHGIPARGRLQSATLCLQPVRE